MPEFVDNAVDSRAIERTLRVDLVVRPESKVLTAIGGAGMGPGELERDYLRWGASRKRAGELRGVPALCIAKRCMRTGTEAIKPAGRVMKARPRSACG